MRKLKPWIPHTRNFQNHIYYYNLGISNDLQDTVYKRVDKLYDEYLETKKNKRYAWFLDILVRNCKMDLMCYYEYVKIHIRKCKADGCPEACDTLEEAFLENLTDIQNKSFLFILKYVGKYRGTLGYSEERLKKHNKMMNELMKDITDKLLANKEKK